MVTLQEGAMEFINKKDVKGLNQFYLSVITQLMDENDRKIQSFKQKIDETPVTNIGEFDIKIKNIASLEIDLYYIWSRIAPHCPFCERMLEHDDYKWLKCENNDNIRNFLQLDKSKYVFKEIKCDWNDRSSDHDDHPHYSDVPTREGANWIRARGKSILSFPTMVIRLHTLNPIKSTQTTFIRRTFRALGTWEPMFLETETTSGKIYEPAINRETGEQEYDFVFHIKDLLLGFLEDSKQKVDEIIKKGTHGPQRDIFAHDKLLFKSNK